MALDTVLQRFIEQRPISVMLKIVLENAFSAEAFDRIFAATAERQYTKDLAFSSLADLVSQVALGPKASIHAAFLQERENLPVTLGAVYAKLRGVETPVMQQLVVQTSATLAAVGDHLTAVRVQPVSGYRLKVIDGCAQAGTDHRLAVVRDTNAAALPGWTLVGYDYASDLIRYVVPCGDAHANERRFMDRMLDWVEAKDLILADRNFCTGEFLGAVADRGAAFLIRRHGAMEVTPTGEWQSRGRCKTGVVWEAKVVLSSGLACRAIRIVRDKPLADGGTEVMLLTNLSWRTKAQSLATLYLQRWTVEEAFRQLTQYLSCEVKTLGYPGASLFAFTMAVLAYNALGCVRAALASVRGRKRVADEVSNYYLATEMQGCMEGLLVAVPESVWEYYAKLSPAKLATVLKEIVGHVDWRRYKKSPRQPKKPPNRKKVKRGSHVSTGKLLVKQGSEWTATVT